MMCRSNLQPILCTCYPELFIREKMSRFYQQTTTKNSPNKLFTKYYIDRLRLDNEDRYNVLKKIVYNNITLCLYIYSYIVRTYNRNNSK